MIQRKAKRTAKIGVFAVIHEIYFEQFEGLRESLSGYHNDLIEMIKTNDVEVVDFGFVGNNTKAYEVAEEIKKQNAAIAYKLTNNSNIDAAPMITVVNEHPQPEPPFVDSQKVTLNPAEPLVMPDAKTSASVTGASKKNVDDNFDDFK